MISEETISVSKTARYYTLGDQHKTPDYLWIVLHGYGQLAYYFIRKFEAVAEPGHLFVAPEGLNRFYLEGTSGRVGANWMTKESRETEIEDYLNYLDQLYASLPGSENKNTKLILFGFSQGVATACRWAYNRKIPHSMILWGGFPPLKQDKGYQLPDVPCILSLGDADPYREDYHDDIVDYLTKTFPNLTYHSYKGEHRIESGELQKVINLLFKMEV